MATGQIHYADFSTPPAAQGRIHYATLELPETLVGRIHYAEFQIGAASTASGRIHYAAFTAPAAPDAVAPSGLRQLTSTEAWWNVATYQRTTAGEWV